MHLEHLGDSLVWGGCGWRMVFVAGTRVWLGFTYQPRANGADDSMPRLAVSKLHCGAPMNWCTLSNPNRMWSLKNEIGYFRPQHHHIVEFNSLLISLMSSELWPSEDWPRNALRTPWRLLGMGWPRMMDGLHGWKKGVTRVHLPT